MLPPDGAEACISAWRDGDQLRDVVLDAIAGFPLPGGIQQFDPDAFLEFLNRKGA